MRKLVTALVFLACVLTAAGRLLPSWPYEKLFAEADIVVVAEPLFTVDTKDVFEHKGNKPDVFTGMNTEFEVRWVLKGEQKKGKFTVLHFRYGDPPPGQVPAVRNGALFVRFRLEGRSFAGRTLVDEGIDSASPPPINSVTKREGKPDYLLFLKLRTDGRYEPVSGQYDSELSCREVSSADSYFGPVDDLNP